MTVLEAKDRIAVPVTAVLCEISLRNGAKLYWSSNRCERNGQSYQPRILTEDMPAWRLQSELTAESAGTIQLTVANADGAISQLRQEGNLRGASLTLFAATLEQRTVQDAYAVFTGLIDNVLDADSRTARINVVSRLSAVRTSFPPLRIQKQCAWTFPKNEEERNAALSSGEDGRYSSLFRCGYSAGLPGGFGNLNGSVPFNSCDYTRVSCEQRGMFRRDASDQVTARFSGIEYVPPLIQIRGHGESGGRLSSLASLDTRYNDVVPAVYGMGWLQAPVVFSRNDGNLTRSEVLLGLGEIEEVVKVVVNGYEIPRGVDGQNMTGSGWYNVVSQGGRSGGFNLNFTDSSGNPQGDPYGSMAFLSVVVPNKISDSRSTPRVEVLMKGIRLPVLDANGALVNTQWSANPAWIICDILRRTGWRLEELNLESFVSAAAHCDAPVSVLDANGVARQMKRFETNLILRRRYSVAELLRGVRLASLLRLGIDRTGRIYVSPEGTLAQQQPVKPAGSNAEATQDGGWAAYEFDDGKYGKTGFLVKSNGDPDFHVFAQPSVESANRVSAEIQDSLNEFRQDSFTLADSDDIAERRQEIQQVLPVLGLPHLPQAMRIGQTWLNKSIAGNVYVRFRTSIRGLHLRPGDLLRITYVKHGFDRTLFRVIETNIQPTLGLIEISAQLHQDHWYSDSAQARYDRRRLYSWAKRTPWAVIPGEVTESLVLDETGQEKAAIRIPFIRPSRPTAALAVPLVSFQYSISSTGGALPAGTYFYGLTAVDASGAESELSTLIPVRIDTNGSTHQVTLQSLSFAPGALSVNVYRGLSPYRLTRVQSGIPPASSIVDAGVAASSTPPPDANYRAVRSYYRRQFLPPQAADVFSPLSLGASALSLTPDEWVGKSITIRSGRGKGQERRIVSHTENTFTVDEAWQTMPDATSQFAIVQTEWTSAQESEASEVVVLLPLLSTETFEINLRSVGVNDEELAAAESPLIAWQIGVGGSGGLDSGVPPAAAFALRLLEGGTVSIGGFSFTEFTNLNTAYAAKLGIWFWDELNAPTSLSLTTAATAQDTSLTISGLVQPLVEDDRVQVGEEIFRIASRVGNTNTYIVERGSSLSPVSSHTAGTTLFKLDRRDEVITLLPGLLSATAGARFRYNTVLPNVRIAAADLSIYNRIGQGAVREECYTQLIDGGLRTLSGGQISFSIAGYLMIEASATSPYVAERDLVVGDVYASVVEPPVGAPVQIVLRVDGSEYCSLSIAAGSFTSAPVSRFNVAPIPAGAAITVDILNVPPASLGTPGRDLAVFLQV